MTILVKDIMSKPVLKIDYNASVERAGKEMAKNRKYAYGGCCFTRDLRRL